jgi:anthranilate synthase
VVDNHAAKAWIDRYDFTAGDVNTEGRDARLRPNRSNRPIRSRPRAITRPANMPELVKRAKESFKRGDLFEVVPGQTFFERCEAKPSEISRRLKAINPFALFVLHQSWGIRSI